MKTLVGFWGVPGGVGGKTHIVEGSKNLCGAKMHAKAQFQLCGPPSVVIPECRNCQKQWKLHRSTP